MFGVLPLACILVSVWPRQGLCENSPPSKPSLGTCGAPWYLRMTCILEQLVGGIPTPLKNDGVRQWEGWHPICIYTYYIYDYIYIYYIWILENNGPMDTKHFQTTMFQVTSFMALMNSVLLILPEPSWVLATLPTLRLVLAVGCWGWGSLGANFTQWCQDMPSVSKCQYREPWKVIAILPPASRVFSSPRMGYDGLDVSFAFRMISARLLVALV